ncbi:hypothetical protein F5141DRAFT_502246 [Pisolithus sp. B1]|nr:hypothetical protein F5141DRAFT_502246 [Pisolithus sp. B1]
MTSCPHRSELEKLQPPKLSQSVHREECTQCFDNQVNAVVRFVDRLRPCFRRTEMWVWTFVCYASMSMS